MLIENLQWNSENVISHCMLRDDSNDWINIKKINCNN